VVLTLYHSRDDLDPRTDLETELMISKSLINSDLGKAVRVLVPKSGARRLIAEGPRAL
jgi:hypothetical protein